MKKTWIKIKRGILEPKHRERLGIRIWLYLHIIDRADWETGTVVEWRDRDEADQLQMPQRTLEQQRQQLQADGYITCIQRKNHQDIVIHNWVNPREYSGEVKNKGTENNVPSENDEGTNEGTNKGTNKGSRKPSTPSLSSHDQESINQEEQEATPPPEITLDFDTPGSRVLYAAIERERKAKGHRAPSKFPTVACKEKFLIAETRLKPDVLKEGINRALEKSITSLPDIVDWVAKWGVNGNGYKPATQPRQENAFDRMRREMEATR